MKMSRTEETPGGDVASASGLSVHPLRIEAETGAIVSAVYFDAETGSVFIVDGAADRCRQESGQSRAEKVSGREVLDGIIG